MAAKLVLTQGDFLNLIEWNNTGSTVESCRGQPDARQPGARQPEASKWVCNKMMIHIHTNPLICDGDVLCQLELSASPGTVAKNRSDDKGPEPEGVTVAVINKKPYAFIALERIGGVMVYDLSNPLAPKYVTYANNRAFPANNATDDLGSEGIIFISDKESPTGQPLVLLANETSNSVSIFQVKDKTQITVGTKDLTQAAYSFKVYPNPVHDRLYFSKLLSGNVYNVMGQWVRSFQKVDQIDVQGFTTGLYVLQAENGEFVRFVVE